MATLVVYLTVGKIYYIINSKSVEVMLLLGVNHLLCCAAVGGDALAVDEVTFGIAQK